MTTSRLRGTIMTLCGHDGIGRHARFRFLCFALGFESPCPHQITGIPLWGVPVIKIQRGGLEHFNPTCRWQVGQFRLDGIASLRFAFGKSAASPHARTKYLQIPFGIWRYFCLRKRGDSRKAVKKTCQWHVFRPWESPSDSRRIRYGCGWNLNTSDAQKRWYGRTFGKSYITTRTK